MRLQLETPFEHRISVNHVYYNIWTPLLAACKFGHVDVARLLIEKGADVGQAKNNGATPLLVSCFNGHDDVARLLMEHGADVGQVGKKGVTPLHVACYI